MPPTLDPETTDAVEPASPTFRFYSGALKAFEKDVNGETRKYLSCTASSTIKDLHGDVMTDACVIDMAPQAKRKSMTIFLNHSYKVPEDVFGKTMDARIVSRSTDDQGNAVYDLDLEIALDESNERAKATYASIKDQGIKLGVSIGAIIEDWAFIDEEEGWWGGLEIKAVNLLEASIVGIPANQRSWVVNGLNALGAPREIIWKAIGRSPEKPAEPKAKAAAIAPEAVGELHEVKHSYFIDGVDVTETVTIKTTDTIIKDDTPAAPDKETTDGLTDSDDPADDLDETAGMVESLKAAGASGEIQELFLSLLEGAAEEVASLREQLSQRTAELATVTGERDQARQDVLEAAEIVETIARTPLGRKARFTGPVSTFRQKFGGLYDAETLRLLEGEPSDE